jgi:hypothetical protein
MLQNVAVEISTVRHKEENSLPSRTVAAESELEGVKPLFYYTEGDPVRYEDKKTA